MVAEIRTPISTSPESRSTTPQITDWFALALCPLICLDAIIWPAGTVTLRDSSGQDGRGGKTLQVAGHEFCVFVTAPSQKGCLSQLPILGPFGKRQLLSPSALTRLTMCQSADLC